MKIAGMAVGIVGLLVVMSVCRAQTTGGTTGTSAGDTVTGTKPGTDLSAGKPDDTAFKKTLQALYDKAVVATKKKDESVLAAMRARDFTYKDAGNKVYTRDQVETEERRALAEIKTIDSVSSQVDTVKVEGGKATAAVRQAFNGTIADAQNKTHKMTIALTTRDVWLQNKDGWKLQSVQVNSRQETRDGQPFNPDATQNSNNGAQNSNHGNQNNAYNNRNGGYYPRNGYRGYHSPKVNTPKITKAAKNKRGNSVP